MSSVPADAPHADVELDRADLPLEERKFQLDVQRFELERLKFQRDGSLFGRLLPTLTTVMAALIGLFGVVWQQDLHQDQQDAQRSKQENQAKTDSAAQNYIQSNLSALKADLSEQIDQRARILATNPPPVAKEIFTRLERQSGTAAVQQVWDQGLQVVNGAPAPAGGTVYVHYREPFKDAAVTAVMTALTKAGYYVPGKQKVVQKTDGDVRWFADPSDAGTAQKARAIATLVEDALASADVKASIRPMNLHTTYPKMPSTTFEVWLPAMPNAGGGGPLPGGSGN